MTEYLTTKMMKRDLKPENILFESTKEGSLLKIVGFGNSTVFDTSTKMKKLLGTVIVFFPQLCF